MHDQQIAASSRAHAPKRALVLAGGGITGFLYEVGVLTALDELAGAPLSIEDFDMYVGTSAGSVLAALLANGAKPAEIYEAIATDSTDKAFFFTPREILGIAGGGPAGLICQFLKALAGTIGRTLRARRWPTFAQFLIDFQAHHPPGFYSTEALERTLCSRFSDLGYAHEFGQLNRELYITGTDLDTGEHLIFGEGEFRDFHICKSVAASCAIPIFFRPIRVGERDVVDGAISEISSVRTAIERGATDILSINPLVPIYNDRSRVCLPLDGGRCARLMEQGVVWIGEQSLRLMRDAVRETISDCIRDQYPDVRIVELEPARDEMTMFIYGSMSFSASKEILEYARSSAHKFFSQNPWNPRRMTATAG